MRAGELIKQIGCGDHPLNQPLLKTAQVVPGVLDEAEAGPGLGHCVLQLSRVEGRPVGQIEHQLVPEATPLRPPHLEIPMPPPLHVEALVFVQDNLPIDTPADPQGGDSVLGDAKSVQSECVELAYGGGLLVGQPLLAETQGALLYLLSNRGAWKYLSLD